MRLTMTQNPKMNPRFRRMFALVAALQLAAVSGLVGQATAQAVPEQSGSSVQRSGSDRQMYREAMEEADQKIAEEVKAHSGLMKNLEYLTTEIGPRLTGSPQMQAASEWTLKRFREYGVDAHLETLQIAHAWQRGNDTAEITSPINRRVEVRSFGWSKATNGAVSGPVVILNVKTLNDLAQYKDKLKGAIILPGKPQEPINEEEAETAYDAVIPPPKGLPKEGKMSFRERFRMLKLVGEAGAVAILIDSAKEDNLFNMSGGYDHYQPSGVPIAYISHEEYSLIYRLHEAGPVNMKVDLEGKFSPGPVPASITVAEIKGSELPDERVIIGGHLDSWDLGQGALDNGTGAMSVLEAARTLKALHLQPKRTIAFVLFTGEEQGGIGANTFIKNHEAELSKIDAVLIDDTGTGKVFSIALENLWETAPLMKEIYLPLQEVFDLRPLSTRFFGASDHEPFLRKGVPAYFCMQKPDHYGNAHHSQADTFDKVIPDEVNEGAALLAAWAWNVSEMPQALPHHAIASERAGME
jgi:carboxypeptidase Q